MRPLLAIIHFELLMQLKSARFKGMIALVLLMDLGLYGSGVRNQQLLPSQSFLDEGVLPFYLGAVVFAGLFAMGRIRKTGMHAILMVRPFHTFHLVLGQTIAAMISLLIPLALIFFPSGLLLVWRAGIEYPLTPLFYILLFYFIPSICAVLSITLWVRACFKNNIMSLVILGMIFAGAILICQSGILITRTPNQGAIQHFVPMLSLFSEFYWRQIAALETQTVFSFTRRGDWIDLGLSLTYSMIFLLLACYHLRRTEPHRKVIGNFGKRWYHTPTFLKIAADLKIDPHLTWKSHLLLCSLISVLLYQSVLPIAMPHWKNYQAAKKIAASGGEVSRYDRKNIPLMKLLPITILRDDQEVTPEAIHSELTFTCSDETSGTVAVLATWFRWSYELKEISVEGRSLLFTRLGGQVFIEGSEFEKYADGAEHVLTIQGSKQPGLRGENFGRTVKINSRGYYFLKEKYHDPDSYGDQAWRLVSRVSDIWPTSLTLSVDFDRPLLNAPVEALEIVPPRAQGEQSASPQSADPSTNWKTYSFSIPAARNGNSSRISFMPTGKRLIENDKTPIRLRVVVENRHAKIMEDILELAEPMLEEFRTLHCITYKEPIQIDVNRDYKIRRALSNIDRAHTIYQNDEDFHHFWRERLFDGLEDFEEELLVQIRIRDLEGWGPTKVDELWDLSDFLKENLYRGLNNRLDLGRFESADYEAVRRYQDERWAMQAKDYSREKLMQSGATLPLYQMLYLVMGHEPWFQMLNMQKERMHAGQFTVETLEEVAQDANEEDLTWFFDYWTRTGKGYPSYKIESATARMYMTGEEEETRYEVEAQITNLGTGRMLVPVVLDTKKKDINDRIWIGPGETVTWKITSPSLPDDVEVDPEGWILRVPYRSEETNEWVRKPELEVEIEKTEVF